jgi:formylglycine-generating enzyme required for sulfatase activity
VVGILYTVNYMSWYFSSLWREKLINSLAFLTLEMTIDKITNALVALIALGTMSVTGCTNVTHPNDNGDDGDNDQVELYDDSSEVDVYDPDVKENDTDFDVSEELDQTDNYDDNIEVDVDDLDPIEISDENPDMDQLDIDECTSLTYCLDFDQDTFGDPLNCVVSCSFLEGYVLDNSDCNDQVYEINPNAREVCDNTDNNCNGSDDENALTQEVSCGLNGRGIQLEACIDGNYLPQGTCDDTDVCVDGESHQDVCGSNIEPCQEGTTTFECVEGQYLQGDCDGGIMPTSEDLNDDDDCTVFDLDGVDNDCNGVIDDICMVTVPEGLFYQGCAEYESNCAASWRTHDVWLSEFDIDVFETTIGQYKECVEDGACTEPADLSSRNRDIYYDNLELEEDHPVVNVTWYQADDFCQWAGKSLPTESQYEKAIRGPDKETYPWGEDPVDCTRANYRNAGCTEDEDVGPVDGFSEGVSRDGAHNLVGNVSAWCSDWADDFYYLNSPDVDPQGPETGSQRVIRGGNFRSNQLEGYVRTGDLPDQSDYKMGIRCVTNPNDEE